MEQIADILLLAAALGAAFYCYVLARRLSRFNDLEKGMGGAVAVLSAQVDDLTKTMQAAQGAAARSTDSLAELTGRAEHVAKRLELMVAAMHDLPEPTPAAGRARPAAPPRPEASARAGQGAAGATPLAGAEKQADAARPPMPTPVFRRHEGAGAG